MSDSPNVSLSINYLRYWYDASNVSKFPSASYISYPDYIDSVRPGNFLEQLGAAMKTIRQDKVKAAFQTLAARNSNVIPAKEEFFNALADQVSALNFSNITENVMGGIGDAAAEVSTIAAIGLGGYAMILVGASLIFLLPLLKEKGKAWL